MRFSESKNTTRWVIIFISFLIISLILWNTYTFVQIFKNEERLKMKLFVNAQITIVNADENTDVELPLQIFSNNTSIPVLLLLHDKVVSAKNVPEEILNDNKKRKGITLIKDLTAKYQIDGIRSKSFGSFLIIILKSIPWAIKIAIKIWYDTVKIHILTFLIPIKHSKGIYK